MREGKKREKKLLNIGKGGKVKNFLRRVIINNIYIYITIKMFLKNFS